MAENYAIFAKKWARLVCLCCVMLCCIVLCCVDVVLCCVGVVLCCVCVVFLCWCCIVLCCVLVTILYCAYLVFVLGLISYDVYYRRFQMRNYRRRWSIWIEMEVGKSKRFCVHVYVFL
jgi:hypothetical protein